MNGVVGTQYILKYYTYCKRHLYVNINGSAGRNPDDRAVADTYATIVPTHNVIHLVNLWYCGGRTFVGVTLLSAFLLM